MEQWDHLDELMGTAGPYRRAEWDNDYRDKMGEPLGLPIKIEWNSGTL